jgi:hypothetical protein
MRSAIPKPVPAVLLTPVLALCLSAGPARAQNANCLGLQGGLNGQSSSTQQQALLQQRITQLQALLQALQNGTVTLPATSQLSLDQVEAVIQQRITQLQALLGQLQNSQTTTANQGTAMTTAQLRAQLLNSLGSRFQSTGQTNSPLTGRTTSPSTGQLTSAQLQALLRQQLVLAAQQRALQGRRR